MEHIFYTAVVYSFSNYNGNTLEKVDGGVDSIWKTIEEGIEEIDSEIDRLRNGFNRREGFIHHLIDSKLSTECEVEPLFFPLAFSLFHSTPILTPLLNITPLTSHPNLSSLHTQLTST